MDHSEALVEQYLKYLGYTDIVYEPDGNVSPDFLVNNAIAIEVRRLNQHHDDGSGSGPRGLEEVDVPLWNRIRNHLESFGSQPHVGPSWYVFYSFERPIPAWKVVRRELDAALNAFLSLVVKPIQYRSALSCGIELQIFGTPTLKPTLFRAAGNSDEQSGGYLIGEISQNLIHCIREKEQKIRPYRSRYPEWWLVLSDHISHGLDEFDQQHFRRDVTVTHSFDRVILLNPRDATRSFQV
jgi:hypothetical protein